MEEKAQQTPDETPLPRLRRELGATPQIYDGQPYWVIKDTLALRYYRFTQEEYFLLEQLRQGTTLGALKLAHHERFKGALLTNQEVGTFIRQLAEKNLLIPTHARRDEILYQADRRRWRKRLAGNLSNFMFFRLPLWDPDRFLEKLNRRTGFIWSKLFLLGYLVLMGLALGIVIKNWHAYSYMFHENFFTVRNLPLAFASLWLIKAIHEIGHGLICKHYGGEVHEIGFLFMVFTPFLYCNVTDSWTFRRKVHRILVTSGGILTELLIAALATVLWYFTRPPGLLHALAFNLMLVGSVSTVLFNANPLLRYDGYYILMDIIEVPNLRQRASTFVRNGMLRLLGGNPPEMAEEHRFRTVFPVYAVMTFVYQWFIKVVMIMFVYELLAGLGFTVLGRFLAAASVLTLILQPLKQSGSVLFQQRRQLGLSRVRILLLLALVSLGAVGALFWPIEQHVTLSFILEPARVHWERAGVAGELAWEKKAGVPLVRENLQVTPGKAPLARLTNPELDYNARALVAKIEETQANLAAVRNLGQAQQARQLEERLGALREEQRLLNEQIQALATLPPFAGRVLTADKEMDALEGGFLERGSPMFLLADTSELLAKVWVPEKTWARIFPKPHGREATAAELNQQAQLLLYAFADRPFTGRVTAVSQRREENMGEFEEKLALSNKVGGEVLTEYDPQSGCEKPLEAVYEVTISLDGKELPGSARPYMAGRCQISCGRFTLFAWTRDSLLRLIAPEVRL